MKTKILRTIIGLPIAVALWCFAFCFICPLWIIFSLIEWCDNGYVKCSLWRDLPPSPYAFLKKVWKEENKNDKKTNNRF